MRGRARQEQIYKPSPDDRWLIIKSFLEEKGLVRQHIDSYNDFVQNRIREIILGDGVITTPFPNYYIQILDVKIGEPTAKEATGSVLTFDKEKIFSRERILTPMMCRLRNMTYAAPVRITFVQVDDGVRGQPQTVEIGEIPVMIKSVLDPLSKINDPRILRELGEDPKDPGGYFIINGSERVLVAQEDMAPNRIIIDKVKEGISATHTAKIVSATSSIKVPLILDRHKDGSLHISTPPIPGKIPFVVLMRALGLVTDRDITLAVSFDPEIQKELLPSLIQVSEIRTAEDALLFIGNRVAAGQPREVRIQRAEEIIDRYILPHIGTSREKRLEKALFLGQMAAKLLEAVIGRRGFDDKDHYANKRLRLAGDLLAVQFRAAYKAFLKNLREQLIKSKTRSKKLTDKNIVTLIRSDIITERIRHAMATGNWVGGRTGVSQILDRTNWISMQSHLRRVVSPLSRSQPHFEARDLHGTQWGRLCPFETPEGPNCGLVKNLALMSYVSVGVDENEVLQIIYELSDEDLRLIPLAEAFLKARRGEDVSELLSYAKVHVNGRLIGFVKDGEKFVRYLRQLRRKGRLSYEIGISHLKTDVLNEIYINTDRGRLMRPVLVVENGRLLLTKDHIEKLRNKEIRFSDLLMMGVVELLDPEEEENAYIAMNPEDITSEHTHMEIYPPAILGVAASTIPYAEHNQSPRNTYQSAMVKQAVGIYMANFHLRMDSRGHVLHYPEKPLVQTKALEIIGYNQRPAGHNMVVAVMSYTGYNMEDAVILNRSSVERGLARSTFFRTYVTEEKKYPGGEEDRIEVPDPSSHGFKGKQYYRLLEDDAIVSVETPVRGGEVLIGKTSPSRFMEEMREFTAISAKRRDTSVSLRYGERGIVDQVIETTTAEGYRLIKVKVRDYRVPEIGDKFASRHGQKGVVGILISQVDMPYTFQGITPDLIINPHALPSRMTVGQLIESIAGKVAALRGREVDGTPFYGEKAEDLKRELLLLGYPVDGTEPMYDGRTGELIGSPIFIGIVYYQRLHHMVADKIHARGRGQVQILTRQPTEGRAREGGLRFGEMERDVLIAYGASSLLRERLTESSDKTVIWVCELCGHIGWYDRNKKRPICPIHKDQANLYPVEVSYAFKLLVQELMSMMIMPRLIVKKRVDIHKERWEHE
ncbi:MAG: DNA-directed RNA polymerase subunit B [Desulfurococcaceae archaeon]|nr:DNA-directed RNA polymerase subunit B [Desulfurococcaceae archaeon]